MASNYHISHHASNTKPNSDNLAIVPCEQPIRSLWEDAVAPVLISYALLASHVVPKSNSRRSLRPMNSEQISMDVFLSQEYTDHLSSNEQVVLFYDHGHLVDGNIIGRKVLDRVHDTYKAELEGKDCAYEGEKSLFTFGALPRNKLEFTVVLDDISSNRRCLLVQQSFFHNDASTVSDVSGGVIGCRGFQSSFCTTQLKPYLSTTIIIQLGLVVDFLITNQNVKDPFFLLTGQRPSEF